MAHVHEPSGRRPAGTRRLAGFLLLALALPGCSGSTQRKLALGAPCSPVKSGECADRLCLPLDGESGVCARYCPDGSCPDGFGCEDTGKHGWVCLRSARCVEAADCPSGHQCDVATGRCYVRMARQACSPCTSDLQCPAGGGCFAVPGSGERYCTVACTAEGGCAAGFVCREVPFYENGPTPELRRQCVPANPAGTCEAGRGLCAPCTGDGECGGFADLCVRNVVSGEQFCGRVCEPGGAACPAGFSCRDLSGYGAGPHQCAPDSNTCREYCDAADEGGQVAQCGLGRQCDLATRTCQGAIDGRQCAPCVDDDDCRGGHGANQCVVNSCSDCEAKGESFCAEPCPCLEAGCADGTRQCGQRSGLGFVCARVGAGAFCVPQGGSCRSGLGRVGDACARGAADCLGGLCLSYGGTTRCSAPCRTDLDCGDVRAFRCCERAGEFYDCTRRTAADDGPSAGAGVCAPNGGWFGDDCRPGRPPCQSGTCLDLGTAQVCTEPCGAGDSCRPGFICRDAFQGAEVRRVCFPDGGGGVESDCAFGPAACSERICIKKDSGPVCSRACSDGADCPAEWTCSEVSPLGQEDRLQVCLPPGVTSP